jgi:uncharacterized protein YjiS (DUF1127 family)
MSRNPPIDLATRLLATLALWAARGRERRCLEVLNDHLLADIGVTRDAALAEAQRPPWSGRDRQVRRSAKAAAVSSRWPAKKQSGAEAPL